MRLVPSALLALVALAALTPGGVLAKKAADEEVQAVESDVQVLTADTFPKTVNEDNKVTLVKFYAPWCGHCKALAPEFDKAAAELKGTDIHLAKVDCTEERDLCQEYNVQGYPTLKVFRESGTGEYKGQRTAESIVSYMKKQLLPDVSSLTADDIVEFKDSDKVVVIGHFASEEDKDYVAFKETASKLRDDFVFGATFDKKVAKKVEIEKSPSITLFKKFDEGRTDYDGKFNDADIAEFVKTNAVPLLNELGPDNFMDYIESGKPLAYLFVASDEDRETLGDELRDVAKEFKGKVNFVFIDANQFGGHATTLNLKEEWPAFAIQETKKQLKYPFSQDKEITGKAIREFVSSYVSGELKPSIKSEPIPEANDEDVKVVVANNFEDVVLDKSKDVLIEFYAPWCGHCKKLMPTYEKVAAKYAKHSDKIVIAKMDATANDLPLAADFEVEGFPTIKLLKAGTNEVVDYEGDRSEESFYSFISENAR
ncbi:thioredoxin-like domain-containing protein [Thamnocephalis sphaerospora]|uniref:Protein disulfide-isomerase n=1 Tax=Thamnocephalis sphaerospora TaxID=78915 RepID=A0A4P9XW86_9FUNG|nr:thioredoxin-like domain-containing protein [Thamnocephalis sphaerospora]|eukprot:RKP10576.1 thioredoxin-like domain-containing protein [Thamnocephalis sphaerospora]